RVDYLAILEHQHGGNTANSKLRRCLRVFIHVQFRQRKLAIILADQLFKYGSYHFARSAPIGPEINQNRSGSRQHILFEAVITDLYDIVTHGRPLSSERKTINELRPAFNATVHML